MLLPFVSSNVANTVESRTAEPALVIPQVEVGCDVVLVVPLLDVFPAVVAKDVEDLFVVLGLFGIDLVQVLGMHGVPVLVSQLE